MGSNENPGKVQQGHPSHDNPQLEPCLVPNLPLNIVQFCCGCAHSLFLDDKGNVFSVGYNGEGGLGLGDYKNQNKVNQISNITPIRSISCVTHSSYLLDYDGNVWSFGHNSHGQLGHGDLENCVLPKILQSITNIVQISSGPYGNHFLAKDSEDKIFVMGYNLDRQLGTKSGMNRLIPKLLRPRYFTIWGNSISSVKTKSAGK